jgi:EAL domain-containing protein (putative c-di-GMP-specific phosphodiesterase class I)
MAGIFIFLLDGRARPLAIVTADGSAAPLRRLPHGRSQYLRERADVGPWIEAWINRPGHPYNKVTVDAGIDQVGFAPLRHDGALFGILVAAKRPSPGIALSDDLPALVEFAGLAGATLGPEVAERTEVARVRARLSSVIAAHAFHPVFQPIVDTLRKRVVAYEALTRFDDGAAPDSVFAEAAQVGLGIELERATLEATLDVARRLPARVWLQVNASPALILGGEPLRTIVANAGRHLVLEVTEHTAIDDYAAFRAALAALGPRVSFAVDDAGAGFASLRHILELAPAFVKLDRSIIEGLEADPARQAMVAGMRHFAEETHCRLIAEGVETDAELGVLTEHGIRLVQGYLLGRPAPLTS